MNQPDLILGLSRFATHGEAEAGFALSLPEPFNLASLILTRHEDAVTRRGLIEIKRIANDTYTHGGLDYLSSKLAGALQTAGVRPGDVVAVAAGQSAAYLVSCLAVLKLGCPVLSLPVTTAPNRIVEDLESLAAAAAILDRSMIEKSDLFDRGLPLKLILRVTEDLPYGPTDGKDFWRTIYDTRPDFTPVATPSDCPALILSDGARFRVHTHGSLAAQLAGFEMSHNLDTSGDEIVWTSMDWSTGQALATTLLPTLYFGGCVVAASGAASPMDEESILERGGVTTAVLEDSVQSRFSAPESLKRVILINRAVPDTWRGGEPGSGPMLSARCESATAGIVSAECERWFDPRSGAAGRLVPGRSIAVLDNTGNLMGPGDVGTISATPTDTACARDVEPPGWMSTGLRGSIDSDGYLYPEPPP